MKRSYRLLALAGLLLVAACSRPPPAPQAAPAKHEHHPPHGGTPIVLGQELYHLELVRDPAEGRLRAYVLDGELESFIRVSAPALELSVTAGGAPRRLLLAAVANSATGETVGDTACFEGQADWLRTAANFDGVLVRLEVRGTVFTDVAFNFPRGNDRD